MSDLFGYVPPRPVFKDIRRTRDSVAERKAELLLELGKLIRSVPEEVRGGSIQVVRLWKSRKEAAEKIANNSRASVHDLTRAIASMRAPLIA